MDYEQHMPGRSSYDPSRAQQQMHRQGGMSGVLMVVGGLVVALALVIWLASLGTGTDVTPPADPAITAPAESGTAPAAGDAGAVAPAPATEPAPAGN